MSASVPRIVKRSPAKRRFKSDGAWVRTRKVVQYAALAAFLLLFIRSVQGGWPGDIVNIPMRLDPLIALSHLLSSRTFVAGSALALIVVVGTLVFGRAWCGWICPLGTMLDLLNPQRLRGKHTEPSAAWRGVKYLVLIMILAAAVFGNQTLLFFDPLAILQRTLTVSVWPALDRVVTAIESTLYQVPALESMIGSFDAWLRPTVLPLAPLYFRDGILFAALFVALLGLDLVASRFWCRYLCPLGGMLGLLSKVSLFQRRLTQECKGCTLCTDLCPTGTIDPQKGYASDPAECTMCLDCLETCPRGLTTFAPRLTAPGWSAYDPHRREFLLGTGTAIAAVALFRADAFAAREAPGLLRPPGVPETNPDAVAFTRCTRCGECLRVCPTGGLQPAVFDAGLEGLGSPILVPRLGYCDYSCNACGQACPVEAIPPLSLEEKRLQIVGRAYIDENRCIAWSDHTPCIVCQEMCPLSPKAVELEEAQVWGPGGTHVDLQLPHVVRDLCIGCGICEYKCPVAGESAIRIRNSRTGAQV